MHKLASLALAVVVLCGGALAADTLTMKDGTTHTGATVSMTATTISFREAGKLHRYRKSEVQSLEFGTGAAQSTTASGKTADKASASRGSVTLPAGSEIAVLTNEAIDATSAAAGKTYSADVAQDITNSAGQVVIPKGSPAELVIRKVAAGGVTSNPEVTLDLQSVKVGDRRYTVSTQDVAQKGAGSLGANRKTAEMVGGGAALGTLIGAIAGHGKGAAIGAVAGAAAGAGAQVLTRGKTVKVPAESTLRFKLDKALHLNAAY
jgi:hypothetical protein